MGASRTTWGDWLVLALSLMGLALVIAYTVGQRAHAAELMRIIDSVPPL